MATKTIADIDVRGKKVVVRVDFNVPLADGKVSNDRRIVMALPTIRQLLDKGAALVLISHLGRPSGKGFEPKFSLKPVADKLTELLGTKPVKMGDKDVGGPADQKTAAALKAGEVLLLENVRFNAGEDISDKARQNPDGKLTAEQQAVQQDLTDRLAKLGDVYVNDAFGTCHRKHVSMYGLAKAIQAKGGAAVAGLLVEKEIKYLHDAVDTPRRPFVAILGGAKVSDKIKLISALLGKVDKVLIGGAMAYTLLKAKGVKVGKSLVEADQVAPMTKLLAEAKDKIVLPVDHVATDNFESGKPQSIADVNIPDGLMGMDIGAKTIAAFGREIAKAKTIIWNGPMGVFEKPAYAAGTQAIAQATADATGKGAVSVIGGGDSAAAVEEMGLDEKMTHVSTGGGASLTYLEGKAMPPLEVLDKK
jgi:phosphoglycerate kinase